MLPYRARLDTEMRRLHHVLDGALARGDIAVCEYGPREQASRRVCLPEEHRVARLCKLKQPVSRLLTGPLWAPRFGG